MPFAVTIIWIVTLLIVALVIVPVAVTLLRRALNAAWSIEGYLADMRDAGVKIAGHTGAIPALDETLQAAAAMQPVAANIEAKTEVVAEMLAERVARRAAK